MFRAGLIAKNFFQSVRITSHTCDEHRKHAAARREGSFFSIYASGVLLYRRGTTLMAQGFEPERGQLKGDAQIVAYTSGFFDASESGLLVYEDTGSSGEGRLSWYDRTGKVLDTIGKSDTYINPWLSPDGTRLLVGGGGPNANLWVAELARDVRMRLTNDPDSDHARPIWSPDGSRIIFSVLVGKAAGSIYQKLSNGTGAEELLLRGEAADIQVWPTSWSPDGRFILYSRGDLVGGTRDEIWVLPVAGDRKPRLFIKTPVAARDGQFSPDGRWMAYTSRESGTDEVYVVPFDASKFLSTVSGTEPGPGGKWLISPGGGRCPRWRGDGKEIFYLAPNNQLVAVEVEGRGASRSLRTPAGQGARRSTASHESSFRS